MKREPPIYIPPPAPTPIWHWVRDCLAAIGAVALVCGMTFVCVEAVWAIQCIIGGVCD